LESPPTDLRSWLELSVKIRAAIQIAIDNVNEAEEIRQDDNPTKEAAIERERRKRNAKK
jgi:hypothetical protein